MTEKGVNQLKRGRVQSKPRVQKKESSVGEISNSASVLTDSIAKVHPKEDNNKSSNKAGDNNHADVDITKTTTVDDSNVNLDPLMDQFDDEISSKKIQRTSQEYDKNRNRDRTQNRRDGFQRNRTNNKSDNGNFRENYKKDDNKEYPSRTHNHERNNSKNNNFTKKDSCGICEDITCKIKKYFSKILNFLGFKKPVQKCCKNKSNYSTNEKNIKSNSRSYKNNNNRRQNNNRSSRQNFQ